MYKSDKKSKLYIDDSDHILKLHDSSCAICGEIMQQITPDDPENRGICYSCYEGMWGHRVQGALPPVLKAAAAGCK